MSDQGPNLLYKFGKTSFVDVLERYKVETHKMYGWRGIPLAEDYNIFVIWSHWVTKKQASEAEVWFRTTYPKTFYCEKEYNGITECRDWKPKQSYAFTSELRSKYPATVTYKTLVENLYSTGTITSTHSKIYFVMLTKK